LHWSFSKAMLTRMWPFTIITCKPSIYIAVHKYLKLAEHAGLTWSLAADMDDKTLTAKLVPPQKRQGDDSFSMPDFEWIYKELIHIRE
jgi:hypothetical protein